MARQLLIEVYLRWREPHFQGRAKPSVTCQSRSDLNRGWIFGVSQILNSMNYLLDSMNHLLNSMQGKKHERTIPFRRNHACIISWASIEPVSNLHVEKKSNIIQRENPVFSSLVGENKCMNFFTIQRKKAFRVQYVAELFSWHMKWLQKNSGTGV